MLGGASLRGPSNGPRLQPAVLFLGKSVARQSVPPRPSRFLGLWNACGIWWTAWVTPQRLQGLNRSRAPLWAMAATAVRPIPTTSTKNLQR